MAAPDCFLSNKEKVMDGRASPDAIVRTSDDETSGIPYQHQQHVRFYR